MTSAAWVSLAALLAALALSVTGRRRGVPAFFPRSVAVAVQQPELRRIRGAAGVFRKVAQGVSVATGEAFFRDLVRHLAEALEMEVAVVGERVLALDGEEWVETRAVWADGGLAENLSYALRGTPCESVVGQRARVHSEGVREKFPGFRLLSDLGVESYVGVPLRGSSGEALGLLAVMGRQPLAHRRLSEAILQIFASRAAAELERERMVEALRASEERYRAFVAHSSEGIWRFELEEPLPVDLPVDDQIDGFYRHAYLAECNDATARMYGYERAAEMVGVRLGDHLPSANPHNLEFLRAFIAAGYRLTDAESHEVDREGRPRFIRNSFVGIVEDGRLLRVWGMQRDVTEPKRAEAALRRSEEQYRALFAEVGDAVFVSTPDGRLLDINPAGVEMFGYASKEDLLRVNIGHDLFYEPRAREGVARMLAETGRVKDLEIELKRRDGRKLVVRETASAVRDEAGRVVAYRGILHDVTERRELEVQLAQAQKMEAVGRLAGGVAHDFNNLLTVISGYSDLLLSRLGPDDPVAREVVEIKAASQRAAELTGQLLALSRRQVLAPRVLDLNQVVRDAERLLRRVLGEEIELVTHLAPDLGAVRADAGQLEQAILDLAVNARDAMPHGGRLVLETLNVEVSEAQARRRLRVRPGPFVVLSVRDTGEGLEESVQEHLFEPFFASGELGKGTGLGLATVYGIVEQSGGYIDVESRLGGGTAFRIHLPRVDAAADGAAAGVAEGVPAGAETILLVEDEEPVRRFLADFLADHGYAVLEASDGEQAIQLLSRGGAGVDLVVTDVVMPRVGGLELGERLAAERPAVKVIYISGYIERPDQLSRRAGRNFLQKPFSPDVLARKVREMLDG